MCSCKQIENETVPGVRKIRISVHSVSKQHTLLDKSVQVSSERLTFKIYIIRLDYLDRSSAKSKKEVALINFIMLTLVR